HLRVSMDELLHRRAVSLSTLAGSDRRALDIHERAAATVKLHASSESGEHRALLHGRAASRAEIGGRQRVAASSTSCDQLHKLRATVLRTSSGGAASLRDAWPVKPMQEQRHMRPGELSRAAGGAASGLPMRPEDSLRGQWYTTTSDLLVRLRWHAVSEDGTWPTEATCGWRVPVFGQASNGEACEQPSARAADLPPASSGPRILLPHERAAGCLRASSGRVGISSSHEHRTRAPPSTRTRQPRACGQWPPVNRFPPAATSEHG
ncbi:hypothetical protein Dimus_029134, partial [Dionaea muscipula]